MANMTIREILDSTKKMDTRIGSFTLNCQMPMQYRACWPVVGRRNGEVFATIPFNYYKTTGIVDRTEVYPIKYIVTVTLPEGKPVAFEDLSMNAAFRKTEFAKPVGYFRHDAIKNLKKDEYRALEAELNSLYDRMIETLLGGEEVSAADARQFSRLLGQILPPSLKPQYKMLDSDFYFNYLD